jgi:hypothetical protein
MLFNFIDLTFMLIVDRDSVVGRATRYGLDDQGSNLCGDENFRTRPALKPT